MGEEQVNNLAVDLARVEERQTAMQETIKNLSSQNEKIFDKLDTLVGHVIKSGSDREADNVFLKQSIKRKISDSIKELKDYHDEDLAEVKKDVKENSGRHDMVDSNLMIKLGKNKKLIILIASIILLGAWSQVIGVVKKQAEDVGLEIPRSEFIKDLNLRGGEIANDSIK